MKFVALCPPEWLSRSAVYQINPRTFSSEGTIAAVTAELPALREMGFRIVYLCPIFEEDDSAERTGWSDRQRASGTGNPKNPYRMNNYFKIDSEYGTEDDLRALTEAAHALDMKVLLDLVYLHIGPNAPILGRHPEFAKQAPDGTILNTMWHFPALDFTSEGLREYLFCNMIYYIGEIDVDGFRCDVGDGVPIDFWLEARRRMHRIKPDAVLINEGCNWSYLLQGFDSSYCSAWHDVLYGIFTGKATMKDLTDLFGRLDVKVPAGAKLLFDIDNHDTVTDWPERFEVLAGHDGMELVEVMTYLVDGIPMVYAGNELADTARVSMFANRFHPGKYETTNRHATADPAARERRVTLMTELNRLKRESDVLCYGRMEWLGHTEAEKVFAFARVQEGKRITFIGNLTGEAVETTLDEQPGGTIILSNNAENHPAGRVTLGAHGYLVFSEE